MSMRMCGSAAVALVVAVVVALAMPSRVSAQADKPKRAPIPTVSYQEDIVPIFKGRCVDCHSANGQGAAVSGLDLSTYQGVMKGTRFGPMVIAGDPDASSLMALLDWRVKDEIRMPHGKKKLSTCDRDVIRRWIREGAQNN